MDNLLSILKRLLGILGQVLWSITQQIQHLMMRCVTFYRMNNTNAIMGLYVFMHQNLTLAILMILGVTDISDQV